MIRTMIATMMVAGAGLGAVQADQAKKAHDPRPLILSYTPVEYLRQGVPASGVLAPSAYAREWADRVAMRVDEANARADEMWWHMNSPAGQQNQFRLEDLDSRLSRLENDMQDGGNVSYGVSYNLSYGCAGWPYGC